MCEGAEVTDPFFYIEDRPGALKDVFEVFHKENKSQKARIAPRQVQKKCVFFTEAEECLDDTFIEKLKEVTEYVKVTGRFRKIEFLAV